MLEKLLLPLAWALVVVAAAGPQWVDPPIERIESGRDLLLAVDLSQSMEEKDFPDPAGKRIERMAAVKQVLDDFVARRKGDRIGLVVFGSGAFVESTFTLDHDLVRAQIDAARPGLAGPRTAIGDALGLGVKLFDEQKTKHKVMILVTDGNDTASRMPPEKAAEIAGARGITVHTVAIGDPAARGQDKVDVPALQAIAAKTHGRFFLGSDQRALAAIYTELDALEKQDFETLSYRPKQPLYQWPLGAAVLLLFALHAVERCRRARAPRLSPCLIPPRSPTCISCGHGGSRGWSRWSCCMSRSAIASRRSANGAASSPRTCCRIWW